MSQQRAARHLATHFFRGLFDFGVLTATGADAFTHMLLGGVGGLVATGLLMTYIFAGKYAMLWKGPREAYRRALLGDDLMLIGLPMLLVAFVTLVVSDGLFPDTRDFRILGPLPVSRTTIFRAKLLAVARFSALLIGVALASLLPLVLLISFDPAARNDPHGIWLPALAHVVTWAIGALIASLFGMLAVAAMVGVSVLLVSRGRAAAVVGTFKGVLLLVLVVCVPLVLRLSNLGDQLADGAAWLRFVPPVWFVGLQQSLLWLCGAGVAGAWFPQLAGIGVAALVLAAAVVAVAYARLFQHVERLLQPATVLGGTPGASQAARAGGGTPAFRAIRRFIAVTLRRSPLHQHALIGLSACGAGLVTNSLIDAGPTAHVVLWGPFALMFVCGAAMRAALALPIEPRANWIFRMTEDPDTRDEQLQAVERVVATYTIGLPLLLALPIWWIALGPAAAAAAASVTLAIGCAFVHPVLRDWQRIPFTCSFLPGKNFVAMSVLVAWISFSGFTFAGALLVRIAVGSPVRTAIIAIPLLLLAILLRRRRLDAWKRTPLRFDDEPTDQPLQLSLL